MRSASGLKVQQSVTPTLSQRTEKVAVLLLESDPNVAEFLVDYLTEQGLDVISCQGAVDAAAALGDNPLLRVALIDLHHRPMGGLGLADSLLLIQPNLQIVYLSSANGAVPSEWQHALSQGAYDIVTKPLEEDRLMSAVQRAVLAAYRPDEQSPDMRLKQLEAVLTELDYSSISGETIVETLGAWLHAHDRAEGRHGERVGILVEWLARKIGQPKDWCILAGQAASLHDIGMVALPVSRSRDGSPRSAGHEAMSRGHTALGHGLLSHSPHAVLRLAAEIALSHHEHWDGGGYPLGARGEEIPLSARLAAVANAYDHLRFVDGLSHAQTVTGLRTGALPFRRSQFDPRLLTLFHDAEDPFAVHPTL